MEVLLLAWDELDDLVGCMRKLWLGLRVDLSTARRPARADRTR